MAIKSLSPLDGRYVSQTQDLSEYFSEWALMKYRLHVEIEWLIVMSELAGISHVREFEASEKQLLRSWISEFDDHQAERVKEIESTTRHDVKAVEYYLKERLQYITE